MLWECYKNIVEICYVHNIFTINHRWLVVISSNLNLPLKLLFYPTNNNLMHKIYCENVVNMTFLLIITNKTKKKKNLIYLSHFSSLHHFWWRRKHRSHRPSASPFHSRWGFHHSSLSSTNWSQLRFPFWVPPLVLCFKFSSLYKRWVFGKRNGFS